MSRVALPAVAQEVLLVVGQGILGGGNGQLRAGPGRLGVDDELGVVVQVVGDAFFGVGNLLLRPDYVALTLGVFQGEELVLQPGPVQGFVGLVDLQDSLGQLLLEGDGHIRVEAGQQLSGGHPVSPGDQHRVHLSRRSEGRLHPAGEHQAPVNHHLRPGRWRRDRRRSLGRGGRAGQEGQPGTPGAPHDGGNHGGCHPGLGPAKLHRRKFSLSRCSLNQPGQAPGQPDQPARQGRDDPKGPGNAGVHEGVDNRHHDQSQEG